MKREVSMDKVGPPNPLDIPAPNEELIPEPEPVVRISPEEADSCAGCWYAGHRGHYISEAIVEEALSRGWHDEDEATVRDLCLRYPDLNDDEHMVWQEVVEDAITWLNDVVAPEGYSFGWHDGEFFFQPDYWWCEGEEGGYCDDPDHPHFEQAAANMARIHRAHG